jgi:broad specificity phosphatase PhoE
MAKGPEGHAPGTDIADPCRLFVVRHGTTTMNVQNRYRGRRDIPLDAQGYQDAVDAARRLSTTGLTAVYTGPLRRTIATAQIIADEARVPASCTVWSTWTTVTGKA